MAVVSDFRQFYQVSVYDVEAHEGLDLYTGLGDITDSRVRILTLDETWRGWDRQTQLLADISDRLTILILGMGKKKVRLSDLTPRPKQRRKQARTIREFDPFFMNR